MRILIRGSGLYYTGKIGSGSVWRDTNLDADPGHKIYWYSK